MKLVRLKIILTKKLKKESYAVKNLAKILLHLIPKIRF